MTPKKDDKSHVFYINALQLDVLKLALCAMCVLYAINVMYFDEFDCG